MSSVFKKNFYTYFCVIIVGFLILGTGLTQAFRVHYYDSTKLELVKQAQKIAEVYELSYNNGLINEKFEKKIKILDHYMDYKFILVDMDKTVFWLSEDLDETNFLNTKLSIKDMDTIFNGKIKEYKGSMGGIFEDSVYTIGYPITVDEKVCAIVFVNAPMKDMLEIIHMAYLIIGAMILFTTLIAFILVYVLTKRSVAPIQQICEAAKIISDGNFDKRIEYTGNDEIGQLAKSLNDMAENLNRQGRLRRDFISNISHDLRSPLTSMLGFLQAIIDGSVPKERTAYYLRIIYSEAERLASLANNILDINNLDSGHSALSITDFDINQLITDTLMNFEERIDSKKIQIEINFSAGETFVSADKEKIQRVIYNLIDNAIKFSFEDSTITATTKVKNDKVYISVSDNGIGMTDEEKERAFERFFKADSSRGMDKKGSGLGLSIVKELLKSHGEDIIVESKKFNGTTFTFTLPTKK